MPHAETPHHHQDPPEGSSARLSPSGASATPPHAVETPPPAAQTPPDFIRTAVAEDTATGRFGGSVHTRFPPEPNGYLHIGHAKAIEIDFGVAAEFGGRCNLRFDDTNPAREETEYVDAIKRDIHWLGHDWEDREFYASDYYEQLYEWAVQLIRQGKAYVCDLSPDEVRDHRGTLTQPGRESPYRNRSIEENLDFFARMRAGEFPDGTRTLRAKIDMAAPNLNLRDPVMYRILHASHHRTGDRWCIYPMYDWAHGQSDSIEGVTHSLCDLAYEDHRPLYDWFLDALGVHHPRQIEFARLNLTYTVLSKRRLKRMVAEGVVNGWDDPRMPTLSGLRRRGYPPEAIRQFCALVGVAKREGVVDVSMLEYCVREHLNKVAPRVMVVMRPLRVVITNYPAGQVELLDAVNNPEDESAGTRQVPFAREIYIEQDDFREVPPKKYYRLSPGKEVRLKHAYYITCQEVVKDPATGAITELHCTYDPASRGGWTQDGRMVKGTLQWVSAEDAGEAEVRLYEYLFTKENPLALEEGEDYLNFLNPNSLHVVSGCRTEPGLASARPGDRFQFLRHGYFCVDRDVADGKPVFHRTISLRDSWAKIERQQQAGS
jgi:glutaminyl-tRNA synthetase